MHSKPLPRSILMPHPNFTHQPLRRAVDMERANDLAIEAVADIRISEEGGRGTGVVMVVES